ncbi:MAG TPA: pyruvate kinase [Limnochordales bacterium]
MASFRRTKIVCTIGPASESEEMLAALMEAGMDVARLNLSHGTLDQHRQRLERLRRLAGGRTPPVAVMVDIQGPKIRLGQLPEPLAVERGMVVVLRAGHQTEDPRRIIPVAYPTLAEDLRAGQVVYLDDGLVELAVEQVRPPDVVCRVVTPGTVRSRTGVALPGVENRLPALTDTDREHLRFAVQHNVDLVAASFVRRAEHVQAVREVLREAGGDIPVIAKLESAQSLEHLEEIVEAADGVMVARGDLGVSIALEQVPLAQKEIIRCCNRAGKPVITATQMLESMVHNPRPTRAEAADVANAILDGTDAVMLSGETAVGRHPVEAVRTMDRIARAVEARGYDYARWLAESARPGPSVAGAISRAACQSAMELGLAAILCSTQSGATARMVARFRPRAPIIAATPNPRVARQLALVWGVLPVVVPRASNIDGMIDVTLQAAWQTGLVRRGDRVAVVAGVRTDVPGSTNLLQIYEVP